MRHFSEAEIQRLQQAGCRAESWHSVQVADNFDVACLRNVSFAGCVTIGEQEGALAVDGIDMPCGISDAMVANCVIGRNVHIRNVSVALSGYIVSDGVAIVGCGIVSAVADTSFGIGSMVAVVNEAGGREVPLSEHLTSNIAHLVAFRRSDNALIEQVCRMANAEADAVRGKAVIGEGSQIIGCPEIRNVRIGSYARLHGAARLCNGTILSCDQQPTEIGAAVMADTFVIAEGAKVTEGAILKHCYVGQCSQVGSGFFAENMLAFANCQLFNGEAVSALAGPFTVSHHKTSLLIAAAYSFFNAGSATNASNHHYKLGPSHQAVFCRGVKTGSGSYVLEPAHIGAYSMLIGHHKGHPDTHEFPFSYIVERNGESFLMAAQNLKTIGIFRDESKWRTRDDRKPHLRRDQLTVDVFTPLTVGLMLAASDKLTQMAGNSTADTIMYEGVRMQRALLPRAARAYRQMAEAYIKAGYLSALKNGVVPSESVLADEPWVDMGGLIVPHRWCAQLEADIASGKFASIAEVASCINELSSRQPAAVLAWQLAQAAKLGLTADSSAEEIVSAANSVVSAYADTMKAMVADASKEFGGRLSVGYGLDVDKAAANAEYAAIKGTADTSSVIQKCRSFYENEMAIANYFITKFGN